MIFFFLKIQFSCPTCIICEVECVRVFIFDISIFGPILDDRLKEKILKP